VPLGIGGGRWGLHLDARQWVDDGAMALFSFIIGLEIA